MYFKSEISYGVLRAWHHLGGLEESRKSICILIPLELYSWPTAGALLSVRLCRCRVQFDASEQS